MKDYFLRDGRKLNQFGHKNHLHYLAKDLKTEFKEAKHKKTRTFVTQILVLIYKFFLNVWVRQKEGKY